MTMIVMTAIMMIITTTIDRGIERRSAPYGALPGNFLIWVLDEREKNAYNEKSRLCRFFSAADFCRYSGNAASNIAYIIKKYGIAF